MKILNHSAKGWHCLLEDDFSKVVIGCLLVVANIVLLHSTIPTYLKDSRAENSTVRSLRSASTSKSPPHSGDIGVSSSGIVLRRTRSDSHGITPVTSQRNVT